MDQGIAWMIAGGRRETPEGQRMRNHRIALAESRPSQPARWSTVRARLAAAAIATVDRRTERAIPLDCCPA
jgi:hypothetical protein